MELSAPEFAFTDGDYRRIREIAKARFGLDLGEGKRALVYGRLARRLRQLGLQNFREYVALIEDPDSEESHRLINALTTNVTHFFRENHHFEHLARDVFPALFGPAPQDRRIRLWSAGCSSGEEPYSLAMTVREALAPGPSLPSGPPCDVKILATDIDSDVLGRARAGLYDAERIEQLSPSRLAKHFTRVPNGRGSGFRVNDSVRQLITFNRLNLLEPWPMKGLFDAIFCRNVVIYFDDATKAGLVRRFRQLLKPHGLLFLGHSESLVAQNFGLQSCGKTIYRRCDEANSARMAQ